MLEGQEAEATAAEQKAPQVRGVAPNDQVETDLAWNFLGLRVGRKTEIIALVAFVLSVGGVLWQVLNFARGAVVQIFPSDQVVLTTVNKLGRNYPGQDNLLALIANMAYSNEGDVGHNAIIRREFITLSFAGHEVEHRWYEFGSSDQKDGAVNFDRKSEARPFPVNAGSAESHETLFTAWEVECADTDKNCNSAKNFIKWESFLEAVKSNGRIVVTTKANVYPTRTVTASCEVRLRPWEITILEAEQWLSATCNEVSPGTSFARRGRLLRASTN
jgi:hypothetical protein